MPREVALQARVARWQPWSTWPCVPRAGRSTRSPCSSDDSVRASQMCALNTQRIRTGTNPRTCSLRWVTSTSMPVSLSAWSITPHGVGVAFTKMRKRDQRRTACEAVRWRASREAGGPPPRRVERQILPGPHTRLWAVGAAATLSGRESASNETGSLRTT
jgi:hypothetical protein